MPGPLQSMQTTVLGLIAPACSLSLQLEEDTGLPGLCRGLQRLKTEHAWEGAEVRAPRRWHRAGSLSLQLACFRSLFACWPAGQGPAASVRTQNRHTGGDAPPSWDAAAVGAGVPGPDPLRPTNAPLPRLEGEPVKQPSAAPHQQQQAAEQQQDAAVAAMYWESYEQASSVQGLHHAHLCT